MLQFVESIPIGEGIELARMVKAGRWIFSQGNLATVHDGGVCAGVGENQPGRLFHEQPARSEARWVYQNLGKQLARAGATLDDLVRIDQYFPNPAFVPPYHDERRAVFTTLTPPSTSIIMDGLLTPSARISLDAIAMVGAAGTRIPVIPPSEVPAPRATSGFAPALKAGEFVFVAGQIADSAAEGGLAKEATTNPEFLWDGVEIKRQAHYVLRNLIKTAEAAGSDQDHIVKAQVYLRSIGDLPAFREVWTQVFGDKGPALSIIPATAIALRDGMIEINLLCAQRGVDIDRKPSFAGDTSPLAGEPGVVRALDITVCSGAMASEGFRLAEVVTKAFRDGYVRSRAYVEMNFIIDRVERQLLQVGQGLRNLTRITQFHTDLNDFRAMARAWHDRLGTPVPVTAVQVPGPLAVDGASVIVDCWAVADT